jgi:hypothetical protein
MKVTPVKKKFGKYAPGDVFDLPDKTAKILIKIGKLAHAQAAAPTYQTRMMQAASPAALVAPEAPYGYKTDGTPRKRPGRPSAAE